jgi:DNA-binding response OmpR family regulator
VESKRILLIDDDEGTIDAVRAFLAPYRVNLEVARDGGAGFDRAKDLKPDAIVLAVELSPQKQGYNLCRRLKKSGELKEVPVLLTSVGDPYLEDHKKLSTRADEYLLKPFTSKEFVEKLENIAGALPSVAAVAAEEIVEIEEEVDNRDVTVVSEVVEDVGDEDIVDMEPEVVEVLEASAAAEAASRPSARRQSADLPFALTEEDDNFDAMLESLEFREETGPKGGELDAAPARPSALGTERSTAHVEPARASEPSRAATAQAQRPPAAEDERDREILDLKERLSRSEHEARARADRLAAVQSELDELRARATALQSTTTLKERELAEEMAARDREIAELREQIERLAGEHDRGIELLQREHSEALARLKAELETEKSKAVHAAERGRDALEAALQQRLREAEGLHERSLADLRQEVQRLREENSRLREEAESARGQLASLESERRDSEVSVAERIAAAVDEARRQVEEELGRRAEEHAHQIQEMKRQHAQALNQVEARAGSAIAEVERLTAELRARADLEAKLTDLEARLKGAEDRLAKAMVRLKIEEKRRDKLKKATAILVELLEEGSES